MEISIRKHLTENGYFGGSAKLKAVRLVAVQRPGWKQVFRFECTARVDSGDTQSDDPPRDEELFGLVREDIRRGESTTRVFSDAEQRRQLFRRWSEDMICLRGSQGL